jgi:hypothetical protein
MTSFVNILYMSDGVPKLSRLSQRVQRKFALLKNDFLFCRDGLGQKNGLFDVFLSSGGYSVPLSRVPAVIKLICELHVFLLNAVYVEKRLGRDSGTKCNKSTFSGIWTKGL